MTLYKNVLLPTLFYRIKRKWSWQNKTFKKSGECGANRQLKSVHGERRKVIK